MDYKCPLVNHGYVPLWTFKRKFWNDIIFSQSLFVANPEIWQMSEIYQVCRLTSVYQMSISGFRDRFTLFFFKSETDLNMSHSEVFGNDENWRKFPKWSKWRKYFNYGQLEALKMNHNLTWGLNQILQYLNYIAQRHNSMAWFGFLS